MTIRAVVVEIRDQYTLTGSLALAWNCPSCGVEQSQPLDHEADKRNEAQHRARIHLRPHCLRCTYTPVPRATNHPSLF